MVEDGTASGVAADPWDGHQLLLGRRDDRAALARWAEHGLARGDTLLYAADRAHPDTAALAATLGECGVDAERAPDEGRLVVVDPARFYDPAGYEQLVDEGLREGRAGVRSYGGPQVAADLLDPAAFAAFEDVLDRLWTTRGASALCCYPHDDAGAPHGVTLREAVRRHRSGWSQHLLHLHHGAGARWAVHGEVDAANDELFATLVGAAADRAAADSTTADPATAAPGGRPVLVLDCAGLTFGGVAAWRAVLAGTAAFRADGGRVVLTGLRPPVERILTITGFATAFEVAGPTDGERAR